MPIKGLTDQPRSFYEIGQLRKGAPKPEKGNQPGVDLTYFRATFNEEEDRAAAMFREAYGDEPREVNIRLPFNEVGENFDAWCEAWIAGGLVHRCDGETVQYEIDPDTGEVVVLDGCDLKTGQLVKCDHSAGCKPAGRLKVIVPELRRLAFMTVLTTSVWDILNISRQLEGIRHVNGGKLQGVPLVLKRRPRKISTPGGKNGKRVRYEKWLLSIEAHPDWVESKVLALPEAEEERPLELPPGMSANGDEEEEIPPTGWDADLPEAVYYRPHGDVSFRDMNDFYRRAEEVTKKTKPWIIGRLKAVLGKTILEAMREDNMRPEDFWGLLMDDLAAE